MSLRYAIKECKIKTIIHKIILIMPKTQQYTAS